MDKETIIRLAREAGLKKEDYWVWHIDPLERFAAHEREECAQIAEEWQGPTKNRELHIAAAIRSRT